MKIGLIIALCFSFFTVSPPSDDVWKILSQLKFDIRFDDKLDDLVFTPKPTKTIKKLIGKTITIRGFRFDIEENVESKTSKIYLCRYEENPYACCLGYGAEAYIEVITDEIIDIKKDKPYLFKGVLKLNTKDYLNLPFILKDAECLNCN